MHDELKKIEENAKIYNDPKYIPKDDGLYHIDGYKLPDDEPVMTFRGKDVGSLFAIVMYINMLQEEAMNKTIETHSISSMERLKAFYDYQVANPHLQSVGCSNDNHEGSAKFLEMARLKLIELGYNEYSSYPKHTDYVPPETASA